jgi:F0F1-type ATP synthase membrane subunit c/vacuolar-type H+-ATPase subunit K
MWFKVHRGDTNYDSVWYLADKCQDLGLLGTMIGFALAFQGLYQIDTGNPDQAKQMLFTVAIGVMTAIYTSIVGMIGSMFLKDQVKILESGDARSA